jgi:putative spermidine/putrescine transport system substrate-binding protein
MMNRYDSAHHDFAKMFMEWVLTDEGQMIFAEFGARPIRSVVGENRLEVPIEARANWLPDEQYANVKTIDGTLVDTDALRQLWEDEVVGGS